jgi:beta-xylosidase
VIGEDADGDGTGEPVLEHAAPKIESAAAAKNVAGQDAAGVVPQTGDEFDERSLSLAWQWTANPREDWWSLSQRPGWLRLGRVTQPEGDSLWDAANLVLQKFPAPAFTVTTKLDFSGLGKAQRAGLIVFGVDYAALSVYRDGSGKTQLELGVCQGADRDRPEKLVKQLAVEGEVIWLRVEVREPGACQFSFSNDGAAYTPIGETFQAQPGRWMGAKVGLFCVAAAENGAAGHADFEYFRLE